MSDGCLSVALTRREGLDPPYRPARNPLGLGVLHSRTPGAFATSNGLAGKLKGTRIPNRSLQFGCDSKSLSRPASRRSRAPEGSRHRGSVHFTSPGNIRSRGTQIQLGYTLCRSLPNRVCLGCQRVVLVNKAAEHVVASDLERRGIGADSVYWDRYLKLDSSMRALAVVVVGIFAQDSLEVATPKDKRPVQALGANRPDPAFCEGISPRRSDWRLDHSDPLGAEHFVKSSGELGVPIADEKLDSSITKST